MLSLCNTRVTDTGLTHLQGMTIGSLHLLNTPITDAGLLHIKGLPALSELGLLGTKVTDAGLMHLKDFNLRHLSLTRLDEEITDAGVDRLKQAAPSLSVTR